MANTLLTPTIIANEALMQLEDNLVMASLVHRDYDKEFVSAIGDTVTIRKPATFTAKNFIGSTSTQDATESSVAVKLDRHRDVTVAVTSKQLTCDIKDFSEQIVTPAMKAIARAIDEDILAVAAENAGKSVSATASPTNLADIAAIAKALDLKHASKENRRLVLAAEHKYRYALADNLSKVAYAGDSKTLRDALLGRVYTLDTYMDDCCPASNAETAGTATAFKVTGTKGDSTVALSSVSAATGTVKTGDAFILDGYLYRFTADATAASGAVASVAIDQPLMDDYTTKDAVLAFKPVSIGFQRNGLALVTRQLALPMGAAKCAVASSNGIGVRVVYGYDMSTKKDSISIDVLYGVKTLDGNLIVKLQ